MSQVVIELGAPVTVVLAPPEIRDWGRYQFPGLTRLADGRIQITYQVTADSATAYGLPPARALSVDDGLTWTLLPHTAAVVGGPTPEGSVLLPNGDRLKARTLRSRPVADLQLSATSCAEYLCYGARHAVYRVEDLPAEYAAGWMLWRLPAGCTEWVEERSTVRLPGEVRTVVEGVMWFPWLFPQFVVAPDGALWAVSYTLRRMENGQFQQKCPVTILRSTDQGGSWDLWNEIPYDPDPAADPLAAERNGFTEPFLNFMPDGSALCLMRTTDGNGVGPLYRSRSLDGGRTWTRPDAFDDLGVYPQILTLGNGITLTAYGRPGLYVRATEDPAGLAWDERVAVVPPGEYHRDTCSYAALLALDDNRALIAYSEFNLTGADGSLRKGIRVRTVTTQRRT